jgi:S-adenosylmethionine:tRNA ribosyltransferase-isomerase
MANPGKRLKEGTVLTDGLGKHNLFKVNKICNNGDRIIELLYDSGYGSVSDFLENEGHLPLPPYINRMDSESDTQSYQTVYARKPGAIAAPTAGLHFTGQLLGILKNKGFNYSFLTLHVGAGTFLPVKEDDPSKHEMHHELFELPGETADEIEQTRNGGSRIIAVGTTVVRVLEHCAQNASGGRIRGCSGRTNLMILPGHRFRLVDALLTNFHLPNSTLLMLVCAFAGKENVLYAYETAIREGYRFYSYGDAMLVL